MVPEPVESPLQGTVVTVDVAVGDRVGADTVVAVVESMKMEHPVPAGVGGVVEAVAVAVGEVVHAGDALVVVAGGPDGGHPDAPPSDEGAMATQGDGMRADLAEVLER